MKTIYIIVAIIFIVLEGLFPWHWHGFVNNIPGKKATFREIVSKLTPLFIIREYFLSIGFSLVGWSLGYYLIFSRSVFNDDSALIIGAFIIFLLGATGYLPYFIMQKLGSVKSIKDTISSE